MERSWVEIQDNFNCTLLDHDVRLNLAAGRRLTGVLGSHCPLVLRLRRHHRAGWR